MKKFRLFFAVLFIVFSSERAHGSLIHSDFYDENGQLIEILLPPFWEDADVLDKRESPEVPDFWGAALAARNMLKEAWKKGHSIDVYPPLYFLGYKEKVNPWDERQWVEDFFYRNIWWNWKNKGYSNRVLMKRYTQYAQKMEYLFYWFDLCYEINLKLAHNRLAELLQADESKFQSREHLELEIERCKDLIKYYKRTKFECFEIFNKGFERIITELNYDYAWLLYLKSDDVSDEMKAVAYYERGKINFDRGNTSEFIEDISKLIVLGYTQNPQMSLELGKAYNDANLYNQAIKVLTAAIEKDPSLKEAYFERAAAYFEIGNFNLALADYLNSEMRSTPIKDFNKKQFSHVKFAQGIALGCLKGGIDGGIDYVPSLLSSIYGLGKGLWIFASDPISVSQEMATACKECIEFVKANITPELLAQVVPELRECIEKWEQLSEQEKGEYIGYVIGRYGVDVLAGFGCARGIQLYRNIKRANAAMTLEAAALSPANLQELAIESEKFFQAREVFRKKCKLDMSQQKKHIPGSKNFKKNNTSELLISIKELEKETRPMIGMGLTARGTFGQAGYQEIVEYDKVIGVFVSLDGKTRLKTKIGKIHYDKHGDYHVVPSHPDLLKFQKNK